MKKIILASQSERRQALLHTLQIPFAVLPSHVDEDKTRPLPIAELVKTLAKQKAEAVALQVTEPAVIIGADTLITFNGEVIGKPKDAADAERILLLLNGQTHQVFTGVHLIDTEKQTAVTRVVETSVTFKKHSPKLIKAYVASGEPLDKAGAYGVQSRGIFLLESMTGDFTNVVGMPLPTVVEMLEECGVAIWPQKA